MSDKSQIVKFKLNNGKEIEINFTLTDEQERFFQGLKDWHNDSLYSPIILGESWKVTKLKLERADYIIKRDNAWDKMHQNSEDRIAQWDYNNAMIGLEKIDRELAFL